MANTDTDTSIRWDLDYDDVLAGDAGWAPVHRANAMNTWTERNYTANLWLRTDKASCEGEDRRYQFWQWIEHDLLERLEHDLPNPPPFFGASASGYDTVLSGQTVFFAGYDGFDAIDSAGTPTMPSFDGATNAGATRVYHLTPSTDIVVIGATPSSDVLELVTTAKADGQLVWSEDEFCDAVAAAEASVAAHGPTGTWAHDGRWVEVPAPSGRQRKRAGLRGSIAIQSPSKATNACQLYRDSVVVGACSDRMLTWAIGATLRDSALVELFVNSVVNGASPSPMVTTTFAERLQLLAGQDALRLLNLRHAELVASSNDSSDDERGGTGHHHRMRGHAAEAVAGARQAILDQQLAAEDVLDRGFHCHGTPEPYIRLIAQQLANPYEHGAAWDIMDSIFKGGRGPAALAAAPYMLHLMATNACLGCTEQRGLLDAAIEAGVDPLPQTCAAVYFEHLVEADYPGADSYMAELTPAAADACDALHGGEGRAGEATLLGLGIDATRMKRLQTEMRFGGRARGERYSTELLRSLCAVKEANDALFAAALKNTPLGDEPSTHTKLQHMMMTEGRVIPQERFYSALLEHHRIECDEASARRMVGNIPEESLTAIISSRSSPLRHSEVQLSRKRLQKLTLWLAQGGVYAVDARAMFDNALAKGRLEHPLVSAMIQHLFLQHEFEECRRIFHAARAAIKLPYSVPGATFSVGTTHADREVVLTAAGEHLDWLRAELKKDSKNGIGTGMWAYSDLHFTSAPDIARTKRRDSVQNNQPDAATPYTPDCSEQPIVAVAALLGSFDPPLRCELQLPIRRHDRKAHLVVQSRDFLKWAPKCAEPWTTAAGRLQAHPVLP